MHDDIGDGVIVKLAEVIGQLQMPFADCPCPFKGEIALIAEVEFEEAAVVLATTGGDGLDAAQVVVEAIIVEVPRPGIS